MKYVATNVEIHGELRFQDYVDETSIHIFVEFFSVSEECWCRFMLLRYHDKFSNFSNVSSTTPKTKDFRLSQPDDAFKIGKVSCRRFYQKHKRSNNIHHWEIGGEVYCEDIISVDGPSRYSKSYTQKLQGTTQCSG
jgi:hypothetical protein